MGKLAIQLSLAVLALGLLFMIPTFFLPWTVVMAGGPLTGINQASFGLFRVRIQYKLSLLDELAKGISKKASDGKSETDTLAFMSMNCDHPIGGGKKECVFWLQDLYGMKQVQSEMARILDFNSVLGQEYQMAIIYWASMVNILLLIIGLVCGAMSAAYLYFYMEGKFNPKLRKIGGYYMAGCVMCLFMALIIYVPPLIFMGVDSHGIGTRLIPGARIVQGKGQVPGASVWILFVSLCFCGGAFVSQNSWKTESGEWRRERHKMKNEFQKWMDSSSESESDTDSDSDYEEERKRSKSKKKSKKQRH